MLCLILMMELTRIWFVLQRNIVNVNFVYVLCLILSMEKSKCLNKNGNFAEEV